MDRESLLLNIKGDLLMLLESLNKGLASDTSITCYRADFELDGWHAAAWVSREGIDIEIKTEADEIFEEYTSNE